MATAAGYCTLLATAVTYIHRKTDKVHILYMMMVQFMSDKLCTVSYLYLCPSPGAGQGIAVEMICVFTFALSPQSGGNTRDLCYIGKKGSVTKI